MRRFVSSIDSRIVSISDKHKGIFLSSHHNGVRPLSFSHSSSFSGMRTEKTPGRSGAAGLSRGLRDRHHDHIHNHNYNNDHDHDHVQIKS